MSDSFIKWDSYLQVASQSDIGLRRTNNQDNLCISFSSSIEQWSRRGHLFIVADGMGAHAAGELASKIAVDSIPHLYGKYLDSSPADALRKAIVDTNMEINRRGEANQEFYNMGTTCSCLLLVPEGAIVGHVGDSRVYRLRGNFLEQLTFDHSLVWEMKAAGQLTNQEDAMRIPKNVITRSLGPYPNVNADLEGPFAIEVNDTFLLCSDGLTGPVADDEIGAILSSLPPNEAAKTLVDIANLRGGPDNTTVIVLKVINPQLMTADHPPPTPARKIKVKPAPIVLFVITLIVALIFYFLINNKVIGLSAAVVSLISLIWLLISVLAPSGLSEIAAPTRTRHGRGPYVRVDCSASGWIFVSKLQEMIAEISNLIAQKGWKIDQTQWQALHSAATQAYERKDLSAAIRDFARATTFLMDQLRGQGESGESAIDL